MEGSPVSTATTLVAGAFPHCLACRKYPVNAAELMKYFHPYSPWKEEGQLKTSSEVFCNVCDPKLAHVVKCITPACESMAHFRGEELLKFGEQSGTDRKCLNCAWEEDQLQKREQEERKRRENASKFVGYGDMNYAELITPDDVDAAIEKHIHVLSGTNYIAIAEELLRKAHSEARHRNLFIISRNGYPVCLTLDGERREVLSSADNSALKGMSFNQQLFKLIEGGVLRRFRTEDEDDEAILSSERTAAIDALIGPKAPRWMFAVLVQLGDEYEADTSADDSSLKRAKVSPQRSPISPELRPKKKKKKRTSMTTRRNSHPTDPEAESPRFSNTELNEITRTLLSAIEGGLQPFFEIAPEVKPSSSFVKARLFYYDDQLLYGIGLCPDDDFDGVVPARLGIYKKTGRGIKLIGQIDAASALFGEIEQRIDDEDLEPYVE